MWRPDKAADLIAASGRRPTWLNTFFCAPSRTGPSAGSSSLARPLCTRAGRLQIGRHLNSRESRRSSPLEHPDAFRPTIYISLCGQSAGSAAAGRWPDGAKARPSIVGGLGGVVSGARKSLASRLRVGGRSVLLAARGRPPICGAQITSANDTRSLIIQIDFGLRAGRPGTKRPADWRLFGAARSLLHAQLGG